LGELTQMAAGGFSAAAAFQCPENIGAIYNRHKIVK
jgi:hypothetical protein